MRLNVVFHSCPWTWIYVHSESRYVWDFISIDIRKVRPYVFQYSLTSLLLRKVIFIARFSFNTLISVQFILVPERMHATTTTWNEWVSEWIGMFIVAYGCLSATYLHYVFLLKILINIWSQWYTSLTRLSLHQAFHYLVDIIPISWLKIFVQKLTLRTPSWSNHYSTSWSQWIYHLN